MFKRTNIFCGLVLAAFLSPALLGGASQHVRADPSQNSPAEMLQDGLEALIERQTDLAAQLFEQVIQAFPGTTEATRARRELGALSSTAVDGMTESAANEAENKLQREGLVDHAQRFTTQELRMKFAVDAGDRVFFAEDSAVIGGRARALLEHQARWLLKRPDLKVTVVGRADDGNSAEQARDLSNKRAEAVRDRLVANGVPVARIAIEARGMRDPVATCRSALCQAQNRHAETVIGTAAAADISGGGATVSR